MARRKDPAPEAPDSPAVEAEAPSAEVAVAVADPVPEPAPQPVTDPAPAPAPEPVPKPETAPPAAPRRAGILGPLLGGALAAIGGFGLSHFNLLGLAPADPSEALAALDARLTRGLAEVVDPATLAALQADLAALADRLAALEAAPPPDLSALSSLDQRLSAIESMPAGETASTAALAAKIADLEQRLAAQPRSVDQAEIDAALARLAAAEAEAAVHAEDAAAAAAAAERSLKIEALTTAILDGAPFEAELAALGDPALSQALSPYAAGVAPLGRLQADFPEAVRAVLALARQNRESDGMGARLLDFLADQTEARPVTPLDGDTPEAILSRAEAALELGRLPETLTELQALNPALLPPLADWITRAEARVAVLAALENP